MTMLNPVTKLLQELGVCTFGSAGLVNSSSCSVVPAADASVQAVSPQVTF